MLNLLNPTKQVLLPKLLGTRSFLDNTTDLPIRFSANLKNLKILNHKTDEQSVVIYQLTGDADFQAVLKFVNATKKFFTPNQIISFFRDHSSWLNESFSHNFFPVFYKGTEAELDQDIHFMVYIIGKGGDWMADILPSTRETIWRGEHAPRFFLPA